jgi:O-antigen ligase
VWVPMSIQIGGLNLRVSQMFLPLVAVAILVVERPSRLSLWSTLAVIGGLVWWLSLAAWTLVNGPEFGSPTGRVLLMALNLAQAAAAYVLVVRIRDIRPALSAWLWSVSALNLLLLVVSVGQAAGFPVPPSWLQAEEAPLYVDGQVVAGTVQRFVFGGVLAGCVSAAAGVLAFALWFDPAWRSRRLLWVTSIIAMIGMLIGYSRQSILSLLVGLVVVCLFLLGGGRTVKLLRLTLTGAAFAVIATGVVLATPTGRSYVQAFAGRAAQFVDPVSYSTGTVAERSIIWSGMWRDIVDNPIVGAGQDAYIQYMNVGEGSHNFPLEVLHSTGLVGFAGYVLLHLVGPFVAVALLLGGRLREATRALLVAVLGLFAAVVSASLTNLIYWNPVYWLAVALLLAVTRVIAINDAIGTGANR